MENKQQLIHIASEIAVISGLAFWFTRKNNNLEKKIEELTGRLDLQERVIESLISKIQFLESQLTSENQNDSGIHRKKHNSPKTKKVHFINKPEYIPPPATEDETDARRSPISDHSFEHINDDKPEDEDLDAELAEELNELHSIEQELKKT